MYEWIMVVGFVLVILSLMLGLEAIHDIGLPKNKDQACFYTIALAAMILGLCLFFIGLVNLSKSNNHDLPIPSSSSSMGSRSYCGDTHNSKRCWFFSS